jgi:hypothetical protein
LEPHWAKGSIYNRVAQAISLGFESSDSLFKLLALSH